MIKINYLTNITRKGQDNDRKLLNIPNNDTQNYLLCRSQLEVETFKHLI